MVPGPQHLRSILQAKRYLSIATNSLHSIERLFLFRSANLPPRELCRDQPLASQGSRLAYLVLPREFDASLLDHQNLQSCKTATLGHPWKCSEGANLIEIRMSESKKTEETNLESVSEEAAVKQVFHMKWFWRFCGLFLVCLAGTSFWINFHSPFLGAASLPVAILGVLSFSIAGRRLEVELPPDSLENGAPRSPQVLLPESSNFQVRSLWLSLGLGLLGLHSAGIGILPIVAAGFLASLPVSLLARKFRVAGKEEPISCSPKGRAPRLSILIPDSILR